MTQFSQTQNSIVEKMKEFNKELRRGNHKVYFTQTDNTESGSEYTSDLFVQIKNAYPELDMNISDARLIEKYIFKLFPDFEQVTVRYDAGDTEKGYELDAVGVRHDSLTIISSCLDSDKVNIFEHLYEVCIHGLRYGGIAGVAILVCPNYEFKSSDYDLDEEGQPNFNTVFGVKVFDHKHFFNDEGFLNPNYKKFENAVMDFFNDYNKFSSATGDALYKAGEYAEPETDVQMHEIMMHSYKSLEQVLDMIRSACEFHMEKEFIKLNECLFMWLGVKTEVNKYEWVLVCQIDVPVYESSLSSKYRRLLYQYIATALKFTKGYFRMLVFHNCSNSLQDETKTLGDYLKLRVWTMNAQEYTSYSKSGKIGMKKLLAKWVTGELANDHALLNAIRIRNEEDKYIKIPLRLEDGALKFCGGTSTSSTSKAVKKIIRQNKSKKSVAHELVYSKLGQFKEIRVAK